MDTFTLDGSDLTVLVPRGWIDFNLEAVKGGARVNDPDNLQWVTITAAAGGDRSEGTAAEQLRSALKLAKSEKRHVTMKRLKGRTFETRTTQDSWATYEFRKVSRTHDYGLSWVYLQSSEKVLGAQIARSVEAFRREIASRP